MTEKDSPQSESLVSADMLEGLSAPVQRYCESDDDYSLDDWSTPITGYGMLAGLNLPAAGQAVWHLPEGDLVYADLAITQVEYNTPHSDAPTQAAAR